MTTESRSGVTPGSNGGNIEDWVVVWMGISGKFEEDSRDEVTTIDSRSGTTPGEKVTKVGFEVVERVVASCDEDVTTIDIRSGVLPEMILSVSKSKSEEILEDVDVTKSELTKSTHLTKLGFKHAVIKP